mmetsp:Transcript_21035/g.54858  ORF Transcript_21035/g.54858 Transcript_21035/m.54858 type:complete len:298 (+) Transcript_21035:1190-2083(+)
MHEVFLDLRRGWWYRLEVVVGRTFEERRPRHLSPGKGIALRRRPALLGPLADDRRVVGAVLHRVEELVLYRGRVVQSALGARHAVESRRFTQRLLRARLRRRVFRIPLRGQRRAVRRGRLRRLIGLERRDAAPRRRGRELAILQARHLALWAPPRRGRVLALHTVEERAPRNFGVVRADDVVRRPRHVVVQHARRHAPHAAARFVEQRHLEAIGPRPRVPRRPRRPRVRRTPQILLAPLELPQLPVQVVSSKRRVARRADLHAALLEHGPRAPLRLLLPIGLRRRRRQPFLGRGHGF